MPIAYRYTGRGEFYQGIPARDLTAAEVAALTDEQRAAVASGRLYAPVATRPASRPASPAEKDEVAR